MNIVREFEDDHKTYVEIESPLFIGTMVVRALTDKDGNRQLVGDPELESVVRTGVWGDATDGFNPENTDEAISIYEDIFFWVSDSESKLYDKELKELINEATEEEWFVP